MITELLFRRRLEVIYHKKPDNARCGKRPLGASKSPLVLAYYLAQGAHAPNRYLAMPIWSLPEHAILGGWDGDANHTLCQKR
jgi:hypothetical protein